MKKGDDVNVIILNIDGDNKRISLGLKQAQDDPWLKIGENYPVGTELPGKVVRLMDKGVVIDIGNDIEGFIPLSHLSTTGANVDSPADVAWEAMTMAVRVLEVDPIHRRIVLGVVSIPEGQERPAEPSKIHTEDEVAAVPPIDMNAALDDEN